MWCVVTKVVPSDAPFSLMSTPTNCTPDECVSVATCSSAGASLRHGGHQDAQKFSTTTLPAYDASVRGEPSRSVPETCGAALRWPTGYVVTTPAPLSAT